MDNPEVSQVELGWLAGILDGEGSIHVCPPTRGRLKPSVKISVTNTDWRMIQKVKALFWRLSGRHYAASKNNHLERPHHHQRWTVFINRKQSIIQILSALLPALVNKKERAEQAIEVCRWSGIRNQPPPKRILDLCHAIKWSNHHPARPETVETGHNSAEAQGTVRPPEKSGNLLRA